MSNMNEESRSSACLTLLGGLGGLVLGIWVHFHYLSGLIPGRMDLQHPSEPSWHSFLWNISLVFSMWAFVKLGVLVAGLLGGKSSRTP